MARGIATTELVIAALLSLVAGPVWAGCVNPPLPTEKINEFKSDPQSLLASPTTDARTVEAVTRDLAGTDADLAADLIHVAETAKPLFQTAIAAGLAQAAVACTTTDPQAAQLIQQAVASFENGEFQATFAAVAGDLSTAAAAAAASSAVGAVGSVVIVNPNPVTASSLFDVADAPTHSFQTTVFAVTQPTLSNFASTAANEVSPTH